MDSRRLQSRDQVRRHLSDRRNRQSGFTVEEDDIEPDIVPRQ